MDRSLFAGFLLAALAAFPAFSSPEDTTEENKTTVFGCMHYSFGQMVSGTYQGQELTHLWLQRLVGDITLKARPSDRLTLYLGAEVDLNFSINEMYQYMETLIRYVNIYPFHFEGVMSILDNPDAKLDIGIGSFPFKYNTDSRDLGEYLFRSSCYPPNLTTAFDFSEAWLLGLRVHNTLFDRFTQDLLLTTETNYPPVHDYSLSYIASGKIVPALELGAGVNFHHLLSANEAKTTPRQSVDNMYIDSSKTPPDTGYYSFRGIKLMGRIGFDPKVFIPFDIFGKEDLRLYSEVAMLGLKNYPGYYADLSQRIPVMVGFNWLTHPLASYTIIPGIAAFCLTDKFGPTTFISGGAGILSGIGLWMLQKYCNISTGLDVLGIEAEYYSNPYENSYANQFPASALAQLPLPTPVGGATHNDDNWKWAVYAKKTIVRNCSLIFQAADDHMRSREANPNVADMQEALHRGDWYYMCKIKFTF